MLIIRKRFVNLQRYLKKVTIYLVKQKRTIFLGAVDI